MRLSSGDRQSASLVLRLPAQPNTQRVSDTGPGQTGISQEQHLAFGSHDI